MVAVRVRFVVTRIQLRLEWRVMVGVRFTVGVRFVVRVESMLEFQLGG